MRSPEAFRTSDAGAAVLLISAPRATHRPRLHGDVRVHHFRVGPFAAGRLIVLSQHSIVGGGADHGGSFYGDVLVVSFGCGHLIATDVSDTSEQQLPCDGCGRRTLCGRGRRASAHGLMRVW